MVEFILVGALGAFLAANMGVSGFSVAFTPSFGTRLITHRKAVVLYTIFVLIGACWLGPRVAETLMKKISSAPPTVESGIIILVSCGVTMFAANWLKVPQSTSFVTVASFTGAALFQGHVNWATVQKVFFVALIFSVLSFGITILAHRWVYPPRAGSLWFYEWFARNRDSVKKFIIGHDCYAGFSVGTNNVANVVAALAGLGLAYDVRAFVFFSLLFGIGAFFFGEKLLKSVSRDIVPLGEFSASVVSVLTATFVLIASYLGLPAPYVQFTTFSVLGVSCVKEGFRHTFGKAIVQRIFWVWFAVPIVACAISFGLHKIFVR